MELHHWLVYQKLASQLVVAIIIESQIDEYFFFSSLFFLWRVKYISVWPLQSDADYWLLSEADVSITDMWTECILYYYLLFLFSSSSRGNE